MHHLRDQLLKFRWREANDELRHAARPTGRSGRALNICQGLLSLVGNTPLVRIRSLSEETGCEACFSPFSFCTHNLLQCLTSGSASAQVLAKVEFLNPGGSVKDRVAAQILRDATERGSLSRGGLITEGTAGSTGISLAMMAQAAGHNCFIAMPDDAATEKLQILSVSHTIWPSTGHCMPWTSSSVLVGQRFQFAVCRLLEQQFSGSDQSA